MKYINYNDPTHKLQAAIFDAIASKNQELVKSLMAELTALLKRKTEQKVETPVNAIQKEEDKAEEANKESPSQGS